MWYFWWATLQRFMRIMMNVETKTHNYCGWNWQSDELEARYQFPLLKNNVIFNLKRDNFSLTSWKKTDSEWAKSVHFIFYHILLVESLTFKWHANVVVEFKQFIFFLLDTIASLEAEEKVWSPRKESKKWQSGLKPARRVTIFRSQHHQFIRWMDERASFPSNIMFFHYSCIHSKWIVWRPSNDWVQSAHILSF